MRDEIASVSSYPDLVAAFRQRKADLGLSNEFCDEVSGLTRGHTDKALGPTQAKGLSPMLFNVFCEVFAVRLIMVPDPEAAKRMEARWQKRDSSNVRVSQRISKEFLARARPHVLRSLESQITAIRAKIDDATKDLMQLFEIYPEVEETPSVSLVRTMKNIEEGFQGFQSKANG